MLLPGEGEGIGRLIAEYYNSAAGTDAKSSDGCQGIGLELDRDDYSGFADNDKVTVKERSKSRCVLCTASEATISY